MLRRAATVLAVAAVLAVAVAAVVDAVRPEPEDAVVAGLRQLGVDGVLVYTGPDCTVHAVSLPELRPGEPPEGLGRACEASVSPDGGRVAGGAARWDRSGSVYAICRGTRVEVVDPSVGRPGRVETGCAPAWRSDGALTLARGGAIVEADGGRELLGPAELRAAARRHPTIPDPPDALGPVVVRDAAWLGPDRVAVLLRSSLRGRLARIGPTQVLAFFEGRRRLGAFVSFRPMQRVDASPDGRYVAVQPDSVVAADGGLLELPPGLTNVRRLAWSPDGRLLAVATRASVVFLDLETTPPAVVRIPLRVEDLAWR